MSIFGEFFKAIGDMFVAVIGVLPKLFNVALWALSAIIILPCVFVAGTIYPQWIKWGEEF